MSQYYLIQDAQRCINCRACEIACKSNKKLPEGPKLCEIVEVGPRFVGRLPRAFYKFMSCYHCERPWCVEVCPTGAIQKRHDGIVFVDEELCVGCKACMNACPWGAPQWNPETRKVVKCDYCMDRIDQGLKPACVTVCTTKCLYFVTTRDASRIQREKAAKQMAVFE